MVKLVAVKLGGSLITNKDKGFSLNVKSTIKAIDCIRRSGVKVFLVHGGGSFGHYQAFRYGLSTNARKGPVGVSETRLAMQELNVWISYFMISIGLHPFTIPPQFLDWKLVDRTADAGLVPLTYGDAYFDGQVSKIISGDRLVEEAARNLNVERVVFALSVPGVLRDPNDPNSIIKELKGDVPFSRPLGMDVTGGMKEKVKIALKIARRGIDVAFVKGDTDEFIKALRGHSFRGTIVRGL